MTYESGATSFKAAETCKSYDLDDRKAETEPEPVLNPFAGSNDMLLCPCSSAPAGAQLGASMLAICGIAGDVAFGFDDGDDGPCLSELVLIYLRGLWLQPVSSVGKGGSSRGISGKGLSRWEARPREIERNSCLSGPPRKEAGDAQYACNRSVTIGLAADESVTTDR